MKSNAFIRSSLLLVINLAMLCFVVEKGFTQDTVRHRNSFATIGFLQIKESANFGLVFKGPSFDLGMNWRYPKRENLLFYEYKLGAAALFAKRIAGININVKPVELAWAWKIPTQKFRLNIGPSLKMEYNLQYYPDLQSGYHYWLTNYNLGIWADASVNIGRSLLGIKFCNSLVGFVSRGEIYDEVYFFDNNFDDVMKHLHSHFEFASFDRFNNTSFEINYRQSPASRLVIGYVFDYYVYSNDPKVKFLNQSLRLTFIPRIKNEN